MYHRLPHCISVALSITQPSGKFSLQLIRSARGTGKGIGTKAAESVKVVRRTGYRKSFSVSIRFRLLTEVVGTSFSTLLYIRYPLGTHLSVSLFLSLSLYSPFLRLLEIDDRRSTMTRVYVPVLPIDLPSGPVRVLKQTRRSRCDPFIPTRTSTSFHTPSSSSFSSSSCSSCV